MFEMWLTLVLLVWWKVRLFVPSITPVVMYFLRVYVRQGRNQISGVNNEGEIRGNGGKCCSGVFWKGTSSLACVVVMTRMCWMLLKLTELTGVCIV